MMHPETFSSDKGNLVVYQSGYDNYYSQDDNTGYLQRLCCFKRCSQFCPKCGDYYKARSVKHCLCLTITTLIACICFAALTVTVSSHLQDLQSGYEVIHHFITLISHRGSTTFLDTNNTRLLQLNVSTVNSTESSGFEADLDLNNVTVLDDLIPEYSYEDLTESYEKVVPLYFTKSSKRSKRNLDRFYSKSETVNNYKNKETDCSIVLSNHSINSGTSKIEHVKFVTDSDEVIGSELYDYCLKKLTKKENGVSLPAETLKAIDQHKPAVPLTLAPQVKQIQAPSQPLLTTEATNVLNFGEPEEGKFINKRSDYFENIPAVELFDSSFLKSPKTLTSVNSQSGSKQLNKDTIIYPPTGPDGSNFAESVKTSQQLTVANGQIWKPVCFRAHNTALPTQSSVVCMPLIARQFQPNHGPPSHYAFNVDQTFNKACSSGSCDGKETEVDHPLPSVISQSGDSPANPSQQPIIISPTIHVPTAISSPNPYFFPTFNGAPLMSNFLYDSRQVQAMNPQFNTMWPFTGGAPGFQNMPLPQSYGQPYIGPSGTPVHYSFPRVIPQPHAQFISPQPLFENPVFCMYVPAQSHQFPIVNGVMEARNMKDDTNPEIPTNSTLQETLKTDNQRCKPEEFACTQPEICIPQTLWCDGRVDCPDASDEVLCSCKHRVDKSRLCDGFFDCPSGEDELGCFGCDADSFSCQDWDRGREVSTCVPLSKRCDNVIDCGNQKDEMECSLLSETVVPHKTYFVSYTSGVLHHNWQGRWYPACTGPVGSEWAIQACLAETGPLTSEPFVKMVSTEYPGPFIIPNGPDKYTLSHMCQEHKVVTHVTCPPVMCGTRLVRSLQNQAISAQKAHLHYLNKMAKRGSSEISKGIIHFNADQTNSPDKEYFLSKLPPDSSEPNSEYSELDKSEENKKSGLDDAKMLDNIETNPMKESNENDYCESCKLQSSSEGNVPKNILLGTKSDEYKTQYEPVEENYFLDKIGEQRWTRDSSKVVGGRESLPGSWPWLVAIYKDGIFHCGGVILNELWVMTAAHCVDSYMMHYYEVQAGVLRRFSFSPQEQTCSVTHVVLHSLYNRINMHNDLALLRLQHPLKYNRWVRPICLPEEHISNFSPPPGTLCTAVGWGATTEHGPDPDHLHEVNVPILSYCKHRVDQQGAEICAGYMRGGRDTCQGDSGGPLLCKSGRKQAHWYVAGVVSHGEGCARPDEPGVYTRVFLFVDWVKQVINEQVSSFSAKQMPFQECPGKQCSSGRRCVPLSKLCDTQIDCLDAEDEIYCQDVNLKKPNLLQMYKSKIKSPYCELFPNSTLCDLQTNTMEKSTSNPDDTSYENIDLSSQEQSTFSKETIANVDEKIKIGYDKSLFEYNNNSEKIDAHPRDFVSEEENDVTTEADGNNSEPVANNSSDAIPNYITSVSDTEVTLEDNVFTTESSFPYSYEKSEINETVTINYFNSDDVKIIDEYVHGNENKSETHEDFDNHNENIPPYLVNILFLNGTSSSRSKSINNHDEEFNLINNDVNKTNHLENGVNNSDLSMNTSEKESSLLPYQVSNSSYSIRTEFANENINISSTSHDNSSFVSEGKVRLDKLLSNLTKPTLQETHNSSEISTTTKDKFSKGSEKDFYENFCRRFINEEDIHSKKIKKVQFQSPHKKETIEIQEKASTSDSGNKNESKNSTTNKSKSKNSVLLKKDLLFICKRYKQPLMRRRRCDGVVDCEDGSDEESCSCQEQLVHLEPSLVCDGQIHCYDKSDEQRCKRKCNKTEFYCTKSKICIPQASHCDGSQDCPRGDDEENCYALIKGDRLELDKAQQPVFNEEGLLAVYSRSGWRLQCVSSSDIQGVAFTACSSLGFREYAHFREEIVKNVSSILRHPGDKAAECSGLRVKCLSWKEGTPWLGSLIVEGVVTASVAMINSSWFLTHSSICQSLNLQIQYTEISVGRNPVSTFGIRALHEQTKKVDYFILIKNSTSCLLHIKSPVKFNQRVRSIQLPNKDAKGIHSFYAVVSSDIEPRKLNLTDSKKQCDIDNLCFSVTKPVVECYTGNGKLENGFITMETLYGSFLVAIFHSYKLFCDTTQVVSLQKLLTLSSSISTVLEDNISPVTTAPFCDGVRCGKCVNWTNVSDGLSDCPNQLDESPRSYREKQIACQSNDNICSCKVDQLQCQSGECIAKSLYCDGKPDCKDRSDEPEDCKNSCLELLKLMAPNKICDGVRNCYDKSDESWELCRKTACNLPSAYSCNRNAKCIPREFVCDNEEDCPGGDDEQNCTAIQLLNSKQSEGVLAQQRFGTWIPKCFNTTTSHFTNVCLEMGLNKAVHKELISPNSTVFAADSFSPVKLNSHTTIVMRRGRSMLEVDRDKQCKYVYIICS